MTTVTILEKHFFDTTILRKITIDAKDLAVYAKLKEQREFNASGRSLLWDSSHWSAVGRQAVVKCVPAAARRAPLHR